MAEHSHWAERIANQILQRKEPYVISGGMTTSGPTHLGTVCEFLYPSAIKKAVEEKGKKIKFYFVGDIMDAFDSVPVSMQKYKEILEPHLGKPLYKVPDPEKCHSSFGEHYLSEAMGIMKAMEVSPELLRAYELYEKGAFDRYALMFFKEMDKVKEILERISGRKLPKWWTPIIPVCKKCGKIATTRLEKFEIKGNDIHYTYACDVDVEYTKGCGYKGESKLSEHTYKLQWRLHWPSWWHYFRTTAEGGGVDHFTKGGSWDTGVTLYREIFKEEPPIGYKYGFILLEGKKYSKSKGTGMSAADMIKIIPPRVVVYHLLKFDLEENIDFTPTKENILNLIEDYENSSLLEGKKQEEMTRAEIKKYMAYKLSGKKQWSGSFREVLMYYQIYKDIKKLKAHLDIDEKSTAFIVPYLDTWIKWKFIPDDFDFSYKPTKAQGAAREFMQSLEEKRNALEIHNDVYEFARSRDIKPEEMFKSIYGTLIGKDRGPRLGKLIHALGVERVKKDVL